MRVDEEGVMKVAARFMRRKEIKELGLSEEEVKSTLIEHAKRGSGCVRCIYSSPRQGTFSWVARHCILQLQPLENCEMFKPFILE